jgi:hypothetical protein
MALTFNAAAHRYTLDGRAVPGVTTLIGDGLPKKPLIYWAARTVAEHVADHHDHIGDMLARGGRGPTIAYLRDVPWQKRDDAGLRGTEIHALAERLVHGEPVEVPDTFRDHVQGYARFLDRWRVEPILTERPVGNRRWWYAGTPDLVATAAGDSWLLDIKTSAKGVYGEAALQLAAYANAEFYVAPDGAEEPMPAVDRLGVLWVTDTGTLVREVANPDAAWKDFLHVAWVARAKDRIDNALTDALPDPEAVS